MRQGKEKGNAGESSMEKIIRGSLCFLYQFTQKHFLYQFTQKHNSLRSTNGASLQTRLKSNYLGCSSEVEAYSWVKCMQDCSFKLKPGKQVKEENSVLLMLAIS